MDERSERRKNGGLTDEQVEAIKDAVLNSIYQEIGKSIVKRLLWTAGAIILALAAWLHGSGKLPFTGSE